MDCVGAVVVDDRSRLLMVLRGHEPSRGRWAVPGGRVEAGETDPEATAREVLEETGLRVEVGALVGTVERAAPGGRVYVIRDYRCRLAAGQPPEPLRAGDDADDAAWLRPEEVRAVDTSPGLVEALTAWGVLESP